MLLQGQRIGRYQIVSFLGQGGMATVYKARHTELGSMHALKLLHVHRKRVLQRLIQEGRAQARIDHPNVVRVTDVQFHEGTPVLVMELVEGPSLNVWQHRNGRLDLGSALRMVEGIARGLQHAHAHGLVHRDLKPSNVLLAETTQGYLPKLVDFGLVKVLDADQSSSVTVTRAGVALGTLQYIAPEQVRDAANVDHRADLFSLGCILYLLLCGELPFQAKNLLEMYQDVMAGRYVPAHRLVPGLPRELEVLVDGLLQANPDRRIQDCEEVLLRLSDPSIRMVVGPHTLRPGDLLRTAAESGGVWAGTYGEDPVARFAGRWPPSDRWVPAALGVPLLAASLGWSFVEPVPQVRAEGMQMPAAASVEAAEPALAPVVRPEPEPEPVAAPASNAPPEIRRDPHWPEVSVTGDAARVWLVRDGRRHDVPGRVPAGDYEIVAMFPGSEPVIAGRSSVDAAQQIACASFMAQCRAVTVEELSVDPEDDLR